MMKNYILTALAATAVLGATAAAPKQLTVEKEFVASSTTELVAPAKKATMKKTEPARISSVRDILGVYSATYEWPFNSDYPDFYAPMVPCFVAGDAENEVLIHGVNIFPNPSLPEPLVATVNVKDNTITILKQVVGHSDKIGQDALSSDMAFQPLAYTVTADNKLQIEWVNSLTGKILPDGTISFEGAGFAFVWSELQSYNGAFLDPVFTHRNFYVPNGWTNVGTGMFTDGWMAPLLESDAIEEEVTILRNPKNYNEFAIKNPYGSEMWSGVNIPKEGESKDGYIVFDISEPDCVPIHTLVFSGLWIGWGGEPSSDGLYCYNKEGVQIYEEGYTAEELVDNAFAINEDPQEMYSFYDKNTRKVTFRNLMFGESTMPMGNLWWAADERPLNERFAYVTLPDMSGVDNVMVDANAPVKYFNLQGMEVVNPAKGQVVIKTQGNKAEKVVF